MKKLALHWKILIGLGLGVAVGLILNAQADAISAAASAATCFSSDCRSCDILRASKGDWRR